MTPREIAAALWDARMSGETIELDAADKPADTAAAYTIQEIQTAASGAVQIGWKLGATNDKALAMLKLDDAFAGPLLAPFRFDNGVCIELPVACAPGLETEFLVKLASDVPARDRPYPADEIAPAVDYVAPSFEIVGCRLPGGLANGGLVLIADGAGNVAFVEGERGEDWRSIDLASCALTVTVNGEEKARGAGSLLDVGRSPRGGGLARGPSAGRGTRTARRGRGDDRHLRRHPAHRPRRRGAGGLRGAGNRRSIVHLTSACPSGMTRLLRSGASSRSRGGGRPGPAGPERMSAPSPGRFRPARRRSVELCLESGPPVIESHAGYRRNDGQTPGGGSAGSAGR